MQNDFIFSPGIWLGEGKISFTSSPNFIKFFTKWVIQVESSGIMTANQMIEMQGGEEDPTINSFTFKELCPTSFVVILENESVGSSVGTGVRDAQTIAWEFHPPASLEGFETYEIQRNGDYFFHAEYGSSHEFKTVVEGLIWRKQG